TSPRPSNSSRRTPGFTPTEGGSTSTGSRSTPAPSPTVTGPSNSTPNRPWLITTGGGPTVGNRSTARRSVTSTKPFLSTPNSLTPTGAVRLLTSNSARRNGRKRIAAT